MCVGASIDFADRPDQVWLADITYIPTSEGWLYLAVIHDLFTRKVVGWPMHDHLRAELTIAALTMAPAIRNATHKNSKPRIHKLYVAGRQ